MAEKGNDLVHYITERLVTYMETPKEIRRKQKQEKQLRDPWSSRWFGMIPLALSVWWNNLRRKREK